jgi:hypothetical protein
MKIRAFWDIAPYSLGVDRRFRCAYCFIIWVMMEAVRISETSVYSVETARRCIPEGSHLQNNSPLYFIGTR